MQSTFFENSCDDGKWPLDVFNAVIAQSMFVKRDESNLSRFAFQSTTKQNYVDFERERNFSLTKLFRNETKPKQSTFTSKRNFEIFSFRTTLVVYYGQQLSTTIFSGAKVSSLRQNLTTINYLPL